MSTSFLGRIAALKEEIEKTYPLLDALGMDASVATISLINDFYATCKSCCSGSKDIAGDVEVSFRESLQQLLLKLQPDITTADDRSVWQLIALAMECAKGFHSRDFPVQRLPFKLLEDLLETLTIAQAQQLWPQVEALALNISHSADIFQKGNFSVLKMCNSLLRKLSKSCNTEFCGTVLMFLASIYPIAEKSAVNIPGKINSSNSTYFEDANAFAESARATAAKTVAKTAAAATDSMDVDTNSSSSSKNAAIDVSTVNEISYDMYKSFWKLQSFFASESKVIDSIEVWRSFIASTKDVIKLFELKDYSEQELNQSRSARNKKQTNNSNNNSINIGSNNSSNGDGVIAAPLVGQDSASVGCKFLTSSQLFALQLRDPLLRQQICVQILYFVHYLRVKAAAFADTAALTEVSKEMLQLHNQTSRIIERTPGDGVKLAAVIKRLLTRENHWIAWKNASCRDFVRPPQPLFPDVETAVAEEKKRRLLRPIADSLQNYQQKRQKKQQQQKKQSQEGDDVTNDLQSVCASYVFDYSDAHVKETAKDMVDMIPSYKSKIEEYIEAEDPDAGIEEEYHPKNDTLYCWRTRRLLAGEHLIAFAAMSDGDIGKGLRRLGQLPGSATTATTTTIEEEEEEDLDAILLTVREVKRTKNRTADTELAPPPQLQLPPSPLQPHHLSTARGRGNNNSNNSSNGGSRSTARATATIGRGNEAEEGEEIE